MAAEVRPLQLVKLPSAPSVTTAEQRYWKTFKNQLLIPSPTSYPITSITVPAAGPAGISISNTSQPTANDFFAVTTGTRVQLYGIRSRKLEKTFTRFTDVARSGHLRSDGRVLVAGDDSGTIRVFEVGSRAILKTWADVHRQPVWTTLFSPHSRTTVLSASDDRTVRLWDLTESEPVTTFTGHGDYVRCAAFMPGRTLGSGGSATSGMLLSGSYDATVRLWDPRASARQAVMTFKHADPVEAVLPLGAGGAGGDSSTVLAAAGPKVSVLDLVAARPRQIISNHQKTVTALSLASGGTRLVTGALDGHVKVFETTGWNVVAGMKYPAPVLSVCVIPAPSTPDGAAPGDRHLAVGLSSGLLSLRTRLTGVSAARERARQAEMAALLAGGAQLARHDAAQARNRRRRGPDRQISRPGDPITADVVLWDPNDPSTAKDARGKKRRRAKREVHWQRALRQGRPAAALDEVLDREDPAYSPLAVLTCLTALRHRGELSEALADRDEQRVLLVLRWVIAHIVDPRFLAACAEVAAMLLDMYAEHLGTPAADAAGGGQGEPSRSGGPGSSKTGTTELEAAFRLLHKRVRVEVEWAQMACQTSGMVESLMMDMV